MSKEVKKFLCIKGCLPVSNASKNSKNNKNTAKATTKTDDRSTLSGLNIMEEEKLNQTRRWLQNISTQANYDPEATLVHDDSINDDSRRNDLKLDEEDRSANNSCFKTYPPDNSFVSTSTTGRSRHRLKADRSGLQAERSSLGSSCVSLATEVVTLNVDDCRSLGITIVGHTNGPQGDCGIFVGCVKKRGVAERCGRIEPGDLILEVNEIDLEKMSNDKATAILKSEVAKGGFVKVTLAKYWDMGDLKGDQSHFYGESLYEAPIYAPLSESHSQRPSLPPPNPEPCLSLKSFSGYHHTPSTPSSFHFHPSFLPEMKRPFLGSELVDWIQDNIAGMRARNEARSYAQSMLNNGFISSINTAFHEEGWYAVVNNNNILQHNNNILQLNNSIPSKYKSSNNNKLCFY